MDESFEDRRRREPDFTSWWCVMANIKKDDNPDAVEQGPKHFRLGETVACLSFYPNDQERVVVLGRHRDTRRYIEIIINRRWLCNFRTELMEHPVIISRLRKCRSLRSDWYSNRNSKETCDWLVRWYKEQLGQE